MCVCASDGVRFEGRFERARTTVTSVSPASFGDDEQKAARHGHVVLFWSTSAAEGANTGGGGSKQSKAMLLVADNPQPVPTRREPTRASDGVFRFESSAGAWECRDAVKNERVKQVGGPKRTAAAM